MATGQTGDSIKVRRAGCELPPPVKLHMKLYISPSPPTISTDMTSLAAQLLTGINLLDSLSALSDFALAPTSILIA